MNVCLKSIRHIVVKNVRYTFNIDTACSDIGSDEGTESPVAEPLQSALTLRL
jgi:hypothetical protein